MQYSTLHNAQYTIHSAQFPLPNGQCTMHNAQYVGRAILSPYGVTFLHIQIQLPKAYNMIAVAHVGMSFSW